MATTEAVTAGDVEVLSKWYAEQSATLPAEIRGVLARVVRLIAGLEVLKLRHKKVLKLLRQAMGITPTSERGDVLTNQ